MREIAFDDRTILGALDVDECLVLLRWETVGRLAYGAWGAAPIVVPVNFVMAGEDIIFRSGDGPKLESIRDQPVSLQADRYRWYQRTGWSVLVRGIAHEFVADDLTADPRPWGPGPKDHWMRIVPTSISGRRLDLTSTGAEHRVPARR